MKNDNQKPIRILQATVANDRGGLTGYICQNYKFIDKRKIQFDFITYDNVLEFEDELKKQGANFYHIVRPIHFFKYIKQMSAIQNKMQYGTIHFNLSYANILLILIARIVGIKNIIIHAHSTQIDDKRFLIRLVKENIHKFGKLLIPRIAKTFLACSFPAAQWMFKKSVIDKKKYTIAHNAVEIEKYVFSESKRRKKRFELGLGEDCFCIGHVGRFTYQKNHEFLVDIFIEILKIKKNSKLILIGDGENLCDIQKMAKRKNVTENILFLGLCYDVPDLMQAMDCFVLPSRFEGLGIVGIEAQAAGLPSFFSDVVPKELGITNLANFISLNESAKYWSKNILQNCNVKRLDMSKKIAEAGYDIKTEIKKLEKIYLYNW